MANSQDKPQNQQQSQQQNQAGTPCFKPTRGQTGSKASREALSKVGSRDAPGSSSQTTAKAIPKIISGASREGIWQSFSLSLSLSRLSSATAIKSSVRIPSRNLISC